MTDAGVAVRHDSLTPRVTEPAAPMPACPNCGSPHIEAFCAACGERQPSHVDTTLRHFAREAWDEFVSVDGRLWRSIVALLSRPGFLAQEYFAGRRSRYMRPFSLFVLLNLFLFVVQPYTGLLQYSYAEFTGVDGLRAMADAKRAERGDSPAAFAARFDDTLQDQKKSMLLVAIPVFAAVLALLYVGSGRTYVEHLVFSVHAYAFMIFYLLALGTVLLTAAARVLLVLRVPWSVIALLGGERGLLTALGAGMITYLAVGLRRFYHSSWSTAVPRAAALFAAQGLLVITFRTALFHTVLLSL